MSRDSVDWRSWLPYGLILASVWLGWEMAKPVLADRAPPAIALRVAPTSATALRRAGELELQGGRFDNAADLARDALSRKPFDARALRVLGLAEDRLGRAAQADELLTLAGNLSLRDDPTHGWLIRKRLEQGNYYSAFAHADTLARRRPDTQDQVFNLYAKAGVTDARSIPSLVRLLAEDPPWRRYFLNYLYFKRPEVAPLAGTLAIQLQHTRMPMTNEELGLLYGVWLSQGRLQGVREVRARLMRPPTSVGVTNGDFSTPLDQQVLPFGWKIESVAGLNPDILDRPDRPGDKALLISYRGFSNRLLASQVLTLSAGRHSLAVDMMTTRDGNADLVWRLTCLGAAAPLANFSTRGGRPDGEWRQVSGQITVPADACPLQRLDVLSGPSDGPATTETWIDNVKIMSSAR